MLQTSSILIIFAQLYISLFAQDTSQPNGNNQSWINPFRNLPRTRQFSITCCSGSSPEPDHATRPYMLEWVVEDLGNVSYDESCHRYTGHMKVASGQDAVLLEKNLEIRCNCTEPELDRNCRYLPPCQNSGWRSFSIKLRCVCPLKWFGEVCESYCLNGELVKNEAEIDECFCDQNFYGTACDQIVCFHQGTPAYGNRACQCPYGYGGRFCEFQAHGFGNNNGSSSSFLEDDRQQSYFARDISATAVSLALIVAVGIGSYIIVKRRTNRIRNDLRQLQSAIVEVRTSTDLNSIGTTTAGVGPIIQPIFSGAAFLSHHAQFPPSYTAAIASGQPAVPFVGVPASRLSSELAATDLQPPPTYDELFKDGMELQQIANVTVPPPPPPVVGSQSANNENCNSSALSSSNAESRT